MAIRTNLLTNPSFEVNTTGWTTPGFRSTSNAAYAVSGTAYLSGASGTTTTISDKVPATAGLNYTASGYFARGSAARTAGIVLRFYDAANVEISAPTATLTSLVTQDVPERRSHTRTAPAGTTQMAVQIAGSGTFVSVDAFLLEQSVTLGTYFDGSTTAGGVTYAWTGTAHASTSTATPTGAYVKDVYNSASNVTTANPTIEVTSAVETGDILLLLSVGSGLAAGLNITAISGCGASWSKVDTATDSGVVIEAWVGTGATSIGTVTMTAAGDSSGRTSTLWHAAGTTNTVVGETATPGTSAVTAVQNAAQGQIVFATTYTSQSAAAAFASSTPTTGWVQQPIKTTVAGARYTAAVHRVPTGVAESHSVTTTSAGTAYASQVTLGDPVSAGPHFASGLSSTGTLSSTLAYTQRIASGLSGSGAVTSAPHRNITSPFAGSGTLDSMLSGYKRIASSLSGSGTLTSILGQMARSNLSGTGTLTSSLHRYTASGLGGSGTLTSILSGYRKLDSALSSDGGLSSVLSGGTLGKQISSVLSGRGTLVSSFSALPKQITSNLGGEVVLYSELGYVVKPAPLGTAPLGKLASFNVSTSATPLNPAEGASGAPSVTAGYIKGLNTEFALGETNVLSHGVVGTYEGEIVRLSLPEGSDVASISQDTILTLLNNELNLFPFIDAAPSTWTAARVIDYWSQQAGLFYDKVPGDCIAYASGYGHTDAYGAGTTARFYEKLTGGTTATQVLNGRSVKTFGSAVVGNTAFHELSEANVPVSVPRDRKFVASAGIGLRGSGRSAFVSWNLLDGRKTAHGVVIKATSDGSITTYIGGVPTVSASVPANDNYRVTFSMEPVSATSVVTKLTVHTDDLDGNGALVYASKAEGFSYALPAVLHLTSMEHTSEGGSGAEMLRWGTYLSVAKAHPMELPVVQKAFSQTRREFGFVSGFTGNVWSNLNEYCAITRQDVAFLDSKLTIAPRSSQLSVPRGTFSKLSRDSERRDKYKQVAVVNKQSKAVSTNDAVFWRADSVFQVAKREVFETTVQTGHSILSLVQPQAVTGIWPFPYKQGGGQYVVTGADGYIIAPEWWADNGGKVEVSLTGKEGEIAIKITAPVIDTVRAPYRISEGADDRPALYIAGSGILNDPKEVHVGTGAKNAKEGFDNVFESPFIAGPMETYDTAAAMAAQYSASVADVSFELPNDFYTPSRFGQFPAGARFTDGKQVYRIKDASQTHNKVSGNAVPNTTIGEYVASYPAGATIADEKARHFGRTIKQFNISPLRGSNG